MGRGNADSKQDRGCPAYHTEASMGRPRLYPDVQTQWRKIKQRNRQKQKQQRAVPQLVLEPEAAVDEGPARPASGPRKMASGDEEWYTPKDLLDPVRAVLGEI